MREWIRAFRHPSTVSTIVYLPVAMAIAIFVTLDPAGTSAFSWPI